MPLEDRPAHQSCREQTGRDINRQERLSGGENNSRSDVFKSVHNVKAGRAGSDLWQIEFTGDGWWGILGIRENEANAPRFQRSGEKAGGVCVFGGADAALGAGVGFGVAGCGHGLLRWGDVSAARACAEEEFGRYQFGERCADGWLRASRAESGDGLQHGVLPSDGSGCDRCDCFCTAKSCGDFCAASHWSSGTRHVIFGEFFCFWSGFSSSANTSPESVETPLHPLLSL